MKFSNLTFGNRQVICENVYFIPSQRSLHEMNLRTVIFKKKIYIQVKRTEEKIILTLVINKFMPTDFCSDKYLKILQIPSSLYTRVYTIELIS